MTRAWHHILFHSILLSWHNETRTFTVLGSVLAARSKSQPMSWFANNVIWCVSLMMCRSYGLNRPDLPRYRYSCMGVTVDIRVAALSTPATMYVSLKKLYVLDPYWNWQVDFSICELMIRCIHTLSCVLDRLGLTLMQFGSINLYAYVHLKRIQFWEYWIVPTNKAHVEFWNSFN